MIAGALAYCWLYESWLSDDGLSSAEEERSLFRLSRDGEKMRWRLANVAILAIAFEVGFSGVRSWGICVALAVVAFGYLSGPHLTTRYGGEIDLTPSQQATRRRWAIAPALLFLFKGTNFHVEPYNAYLLAFSGTIFAVLILVPEPRE
jgi:hypothetical protein